MRPTRKRKPKTRPKKKTRKAEDKELTERRIIHLTG